MLFTPDEVDRIGIELGYSPLALRNESTATALEKGYAIDLNSALEAITSVVRHGEIVSVLTQIAQVQLALTTAVSKSNVVEVGEIKLDYKTQIASLKAEASRLVNRLATLVGVRVLVDTYKGTSKHYVRNFC